MASTLFFIHIRKTGGTSILQAACEEFGRGRVLLVYGRKSTWTTVAATGIMAAAAGDPVRRFAMLADYIESHDIAFYASHIPAQTLRCFEPAQAFTLLRDPVERVLSQYYFMRSKQTTRASLEDFLEDPEHRNEQARMLDGVALEGLGAVGIVERFAEFVSALNSRFGLRFAIHHRKDGGILKDMQASLVRASLRERIAALNGEDLDLYRQAREIVRSRQDGAAGGFQSAGRRV